MKTVVFSAVVVLMFLFGYFVDALPFPTSLQNFFNDDDAKFRAIVSELDSSSFYAHQLSKREDTMNNIWAVREIQDCKKLKKSVIKHNECKEKIKIPIQNECRMFLKCEKEKEKPVLTCCPRGFHFDHRLWYCIQRNQARCNNVCEKEGIRYPNPNNFKAYLECSDLGIPEPKSCKDGDKFNALTNECAVDDGTAVATASGMGLSYEAVMDILSGYGIVSQEASDNETTTDDGRENNGTYIETRRHNDDDGTIKIGVSSIDVNECHPPTWEQKVQMATCPKAGSFPIKNECLLFRKCYGPSEEPVFICCPQGFKFHHILRRCVAADYAKCVDVCTEEGARFPHPDDDFGYLVCGKSGELEEEKCETQHRYDDVEGQCIEFSKDQPNETVFTDL